MVTGGRRWLCPLVNHMSTVLFVHVFMYICDFQRCGILTSVDSDEPVQSPFRLRISKKCSVSSLTVIDYSSD